MQSQSNPPVARGAGAAGKTHRPYWLIGVALVALIGGLAIGRWQLTRHSGHHQGVFQVAAANPAPAVTSLGAGSAVNAAPRSLAARPAAATTQATAKTVFLAASQAEADSFRAFLPDPAITVAPDGTPALDASVIVLKPEDAEQFYLAIANENMLRASLGLGEITLVDLHAPVASATAQSASTGVETLALTVYVVASDEQAALLREGLDQAAITRAMAGEQPLPPTVVRVVVDAGSDLSGLAAQYGSYHVSVVDMRRP